MRYQRFDNLASDVYPSRQASEMRRTWQSSSWGAGVPVDADGSLQIEPVGAAMRLRLPGVSIGSIQYMIFNSLMSFKRHRIQSALDLDYLLSKLFVGRIG